MKDKLNFKFLGMDFNVPGYITDYDHDKRMVIDCVGSGQMVKQYIKQLVLRLVSELSAAGTMYFYHKH